MKKVLSFMVILLLVSLVVSPVSAAIINSSGDTWTWDLPQYSTTVFGTATTTRLMELSPGRTALTWSFFRFNISGLLVDNEQFASAKLNFTITSNNGLNPDIFWLYSINESGDQKVSDSMTLSTQPTWSSEYVLVDTYSLGTSATVGLISFDASQILDYAKSDTDGVISFALRQVAGTGPSAQVYIASHEHATASVRPQFEYTVEAIPEPATMCLLGLGALGLLRRRK